MLNNVSGAIVIYSYGVDTVMLLVCLMVHAFNKAILS